MVNEPDRTTPRTDDEYPRDRFVTEVVLNPRRRYALYYLTQRSDPVSLDDLARQVAAWERSRPLDEVTTTHGESVHSSLRRNHLPYLESRGFVTYDGHSDRVTGRVTDPTVEFFVANEPRTRIAWHKVYLALTGISAVVVGLTQAGVPPFGELSSVATAGLVVALFAVASVGYWYDVRRWRRKTAGEPPDFLLSVDEELSNEEWDGGPDDENEVG